MKKAITPTTLHAAAQPLGTSIYALHPHTAVAPRNTYANRDGIIATSKADALAIDRDGNPYN